MPLIGTESGPKGDINIYTDKRLKGIQLDTNGTLRYMFTDGSWGEPLTGNYHLAASKGYIKFRIPGASSVNAGMVRSKPAHYDAQSLHIQNVDAAVTVMVHDEPYILVSISSPPERLHEIRVSMTANNLDIEGRVMSGQVSAISPGDIGNIPTPSMRDIIGWAMTGWRWFRQLSSKPVTHVDKSDPSPVKVWVLVPAELKIEITTNAHNTTIGDTRGELTINVSGSADVYAGDMASAEITALGNAKVNVESVSDRAMLVSSDKSKIKIDLGGMYASATVQGPGAVQVGGTVVSADATIMGSGKIIFDHKPGQLTESRVGAGKIIVKKG